MPFDSDNFDPEKHTFVEYVTPEARQRIITKYLKLEHLPDTPESRSFADQRLERFLSMAAMFTDLETGDIYAGKSKFSKSPEDYASQIAHENFHQVGQRAGMPALVENLDPFLEKYAEPTFDLATMQFKRVAPDPSGLDRALIRALEER